MHDFFQNCIALYIINVINYFYFGRLQWRALSFSVCVSYDSFTMEHDEMLVKWTDSHRDTQNMHACKEC